MGVNAGNEYHRSLINTIACDRVDSYLAYHLSSFVKFMHHIE
jgi:hypothetical protein